MYQIPTLTNFQERFYQSETSFAYFEGIDSKQITLFKTKYQEERSKENKPKNLLSSYFRELESLVKQGGLKQNLRSFDAKIFHLIATVDPGLEFYHLYSSLPLTTKNEIDAATSLEEQKVLLERRKSEISNIIAQIRQTLGFYDQRLLKYESFLYKKFLKVRTLSLNPTRNYINQVLLGTKLIRDFDNIDDEDFDNILNKATFWETTTNAIGNALLAAYNIVEQNNILGLSNTKEIIIFFILTVDPELKMLTIYEEECRKDRIKERIKEEFGFYNEDFLRIETLYH